MSKKKKKSDKSQSASESKSPPVFIIPSTWKPAFASKFLDVLTQIQELDKNEMSAGFLVTRVSGLEEFPGVEAAATAFAQVRDHFDKLISSPQIRSNGMEIIKAVEALGRASGTLAAVIAYAEILRDSGFKSSRVLSSGGDK